VRADSNVFLFILVFGFLIDSMFIINVWYLNEIWIKYLLFNKDFSFSRSDLLRMTAGKNPRNFKKKGAKKKV
jgi:hypothetical protein